MREVADRMRGDADRAFTTAMTTLDRMFRKDLLLNQDGLPWRYVAAVDRRAWERRCADQLEAQARDRVRISAGAMRWA